MFKVEKTPYGIQVTLGGNLDEAEVRAMWVERDILMSDIDGPCLALIDIRSLVPPTQAIIQLLQSSDSNPPCGTWGRRAMIGLSPVIKSKALQFLFESGTNDYTRYIDASKIDSWEEIALDWIVEGIEPDDNPLINSDEITTKTKTCSG